MTDPSISTTAIKVHAAALENAISRHAVNTVRCKVWSAEIVAGLIVIAMGRAQMAALPWAGSVVVVMDASQLALARICTDAYNRDEGPIA